MNDLVLLRNKKGYLIADKNNIIRANYDIGQQIDSIIETIRFLRKLSNYEDW